MAGSTGNGSAAGTRALLAELEQTVENSAEFIAKFKELARKLNLPGGEADLATLRRAESLLLMRLEEARRLVNSPRQARVELATILRQMRRAKLFLQLKIFKVDRVLDQIIRRGAQATHVGETSVKSMP